MRFNVVLAVAVSAAFAASLVNGCGGPGNSLGEPTDTSHKRDASTGSPSSRDSSVSVDGPSFISATPDDGSADGTNGGRVLSSVHIVPANAKLVVQAGQSATLPYTVMGVVDGMQPEVDVTSRFVFYVPDNYLVGGFAANGGPLFSSRVPTATTDPPQRGGVLTVQALGLNPGGTSLTITTQLTVELDAHFDNVGQSADGGVLDAGSVPSNSAMIFAGAPPDPSRAPKLAYPNNGTMLPPNLRLLDVHWLPGSPTNTLYQISFTSPLSQITYYSRCGSMNGLMSPGSCGFQLDATGYSFLAASNAGAGNVTLTVTGTDDAGTGAGTSTAFTIQFAQEAVNGGVYYWDVSHTRIMRFDFGSASATPQVFLAPGMYGTNGGTCVGCHTLSHDGTKIAASAGGQGSGLLVYVNNIAGLTAPGAQVTVNEDGANGMQFGSFSPLGDLFVGIYGDRKGDAGLDPNNLYFHDGTTGLILPNLTKHLAFEPDHPAWSPDGTMVAMTHVGSHKTSQEEFLGGIDVATFKAGAVTATGVNLGAAGANLGDPVVVIPNNVKTSTSAVNSYNPDFAPDSTFMVFTQTTCSASDATHENCDSDVTNNVSATTWAVKPVANATPVHLDNAATPGVADGANTVVVDTFPRSTPFQTVQGAGKLFWFTVASLRQPGLRLKNFVAANEGAGQLQQQLWMFAVDPAKVLAGHDGSYTAFFLPFQDPTTSNHIAQWTEKIVGAPPAPPAPVPPPPPPPPAPPPPK